MVMNQNLLEITLKALAERRGKWPQICRDTGLDYDWLTKLAQGRIQDPGVKKIQRLHDYFFPHGNAPAVSCERHCAIRLMEAA